MKLDFKNASLQKQGIALEVNAVVKEGGAVKATRQKKSPAFHD
jgi:hypothetical protein